MTINAAAQQTGTVLYNNDADIFCLKHDDDCWYVYFRERHESLGDEDVSVEDPGDQLIGVARLERSDGGGT